MKKILYIAPNGTVLVNPAEGTDPATNDVVMKIDGRQMAIYSVVLGERTTAEQREVVDEYAGKFFNGVKGGLIPSKNKAEVKVSKRVINDNGYQVPVIKVVITEGKLETEALTETCRTVCAWLEATGEEAKPAKPAPKSDDKDKAATGAAAASAAAAKPADKPADGDDKPADTPADDGKKDDDGKPADKPADGDGKGGDKPADKPADGDDKPADDSDKGDGKKTDGDDGKKADDGKKVGPYEWDPDASTEENLRRLMPFTFGS